MRTRGHRWPSPEAYSNNGRGRMNHDLEIQGELVIKRYRGCDSERPAREWDSLIQLAERTPDLAPTPCRAHLDDTPPWIVMSRIPGTVMRGGRVTPDQERLLAACAGRLFDAVQLPTLAKLPEKTWSGPWAMKHPRVVRRTATERNDRDRSASSRGQS